MDQLDLFSAEAQAVITVAGDAARRRSKSPRVFVVQTPEQTAATVARAIAEGRHSVEWRGEVCKRCGEWRHIFHVNPQYTRDRFCRECAAIMGVDGAAVDKTLESWSEPDAATITVELPDGVSRAEDIGLPGV